MSILNYGQIERKYHCVATFYPESPKDGELRILVHDRFGRGIYTDVYQLVDEHPRRSFLNLYRYCGREQSSREDLAQFEAYLARCAEEYRSQPRGKDI